MTTQTKEQTSSCGSTESGKEDVVKKPNHYQIAKGIEVMDVIEAVLGHLKLEGHEAYLMGNFLKYRLRMGDKDAVEQELGKSNEYRRRLRESRKPTPKPVERALLDRVGCAVADDGVLRNYGL